MLEDSLVESRSSSLSRKPVTLAISVLTHGGILGALILVPLLSDQVLPTLVAFEPLAPPPIIRTAVAPAPVSPRRAGAPADIPFQPTALIEPERIPREIIRGDASSEEPSVHIPGVGGSTAGLPLGVLGGIPLSDGRQASPPPPPPPPPAAKAPQPPEPPPAPQAPVPVGGIVMMSKLIYQVAPVYPPLARASRTQGTVTLEAVITKEGAIDPSRLRVVSGHPLLNQAAVDAVRQWRYQPTTLNGRPVEVVSNIIVNFTFN